MDKFNRDDLFLLKEKDENEFLKKAEEYKTYFINTENHKNYIEIQKILINYSLRRKDIKKVIDLGNETINYYEKTRLPQDSFLDNTLIQTGEMCFYTGNFKEAEIYFKKCLLSTSDKERKAECLNNIGLLKLENGLLTEAEEYFFNSLSLLGETKNQNKYFEIQINNNLGILFRNKGALKESEKYYLKAISLFNETEKKNLQNELNIKNNYSLLQFYLGNIKEAISIITECYEILKNVKKEKSLIASNILNNLAFYHDNLNEFEIALKYYQDAILIREGILGKSHIETVKFKLNVISFYNKNNSFNNSEIIINELESTQKDGLNLEENPLMLIRFNLLKAEILIRKKQYENASEILLSTKTFCLNYFDEESEIYNQILIKSAENDLCQNKYDEAETNFYNSINNQNMKFFDLIRLLNLNCIYNYLKRYKKHIDKYLSFIIDKKTEDKKSVIMIFNSLIKRKSLAYEVEMIQHEAMVVEKNRGKYSQINELLTLREKISNKITSDLFKTNMTDEEKTSVFEKPGVKKLINSEKKIFKELLELLPEMHRDDVIQKAGYEEISEILDEETAVLEFYRYDKYDFNKNEFSDEHYVLFVITKNSIELFDIGQCDNFDIKINSLENVSVFESGNELERNMKDIEENLVYLYKSFFGKNERILNILSNYKNMIISPDSKLNFLSFESLMNDEGEFLVENNTISYINTSRDMLRFSRTDNIENAYIFYAPEIPSDHFSELFNSTQEGEKIGEIIRNSGIEEIEMINGNEFNKENFLSVNNPSILHVSTHGYDKNKYIKDDEHIFDMITSGIVVSGDENSYSVVNSLDILKMDYTETSLVSLSACESGKGKLYNSEGIIGLKRSFIVAGVKTVISSLWKIPDKYTDFLMEEFYTNFLSGMKASESLQIAKIKLIELLSEEYGYPYIHLWAGFVCVGDINEIKYLKGEKNEYQ